MIFSRKIIPSISKVQALRGQFRKIPLRHRTARAISFSCFASAMNIQGFEIINPKELNFILGHAHFIETADDLAECCARHGVPQFGVAFCEASGPRKVRTEGNDSSLIELATKNALGIGAGHSFIIFMDGAFPISILNSIQNCPTVARIHCATANPTTVLLAGIDDERKGIVGVIDGFCSNKIEDDDDKFERKELLKKIGYKR